MNIHELSRRSGASLKVLRKLEAMGVIEIDAEDESLERMRRYLSNGQPLTVELLLELVDKPALIDDLGNFSTRARIQLESLGDVKTSAAPNTVTAYTADAAKDDETAARVLANWLIEVLPPKPVSHYWIATRLLVNLPPNLRAADLRVVNLAMLKVRKLDEFAPYWHRRKSSARNEILYSQPNKFLDL